MKKLLLIAVVAVMSLAGCKSVPTAEKIESTSYAVGCASGMVANETKIDDKSRDAVIEVVTIVKEVTPIEGQSFREAWTAAASEYANELVRAGRLDSSQIPIVVGGITIAATGLDYVFATYPKARSYEELVVAAVRGFSTGFLVTFKPVNSESRSINVDYDRDAYIYLKGKFGIE